MALPFLDKQKGAYIDFEKVSEPVLVITGSEDKMVHPNIAKATAKKYKNSTLSIIEDQTICMKLRNIEIKL